MSQTLEEDIRRTEAHLQCLKRKKVQHMNKSPKIDGEKWKQINEFPEYQVSDLGRVRNRFGYVLQNAIGLGEYEKVCLGKNRASRRIHRLVADAFVANPDDKPEVNHKDGNKLNNRADNLEWVTHQENVSHALKTGAYAVTFK